EPGEAPAPLAFTHIDGASAVSEAPAKARKKRSILRRFIVFVVVGLVTVGASLTGTSWLLYRMGHTVISNASVKGRLERIGARMDGQVKSIEVQPSQRVSKGDVLIRLQDEHFQAELREAQSELNSARKRYEAEKLAVEYEGSRRPLEVERYENIRQATAGQ